MKKSVTLLSVCFLFLALGLSSCKKDYLCYCIYDVDSPYEHYYITIQATSEKKASHACIRERHEAPYPKPSVCISQGEVE